MSCYLQVVATHGDYSRIDSVSVVSGEKLTESTIPSLKESEKFLDKRCTESWASLSMTGDIDDDYYDEDEEDEEEEEEENDERGVDVFFNNSYSSGKSMYASYYALEQALLDAVKFGKYVEKIYHDGDKSETEFVYHLPTGVFK